MRWSLEQKHEVLDLSWCLRIIQHGPPAVFLILSSKEIMVIAGDGKPVKVQLGGENQEDSRKQVAEAAGLKHVPLPDFDGTEQSAWAGSLKKTSKTKINQGRQEVIDDENPWAGSLRHVTDKPRKGQKKDNSDDLYGGAPWMG